jgi:transcriptional regulator with XRE-family HTH domain
MVRIRDLRLARGWTIAQLVERIAEHGVSVTEAGISNVETGNKQGSERLLTAWAKALGSDPMNVWHGPLREPIKPGIPGKRDAA